MTTGPAEQGAEFLHPRSDLRWLEAATTKGECRKNASRMSVLQTVGGEKNDPSCPLEKKGLGAHPGINTDRTDQLGTAA